MSALLQDLHYGIRMLTRNPGFTVVGLLTLGLGIGANTAIFSVVNGVLLKPLPYEDPENLVTVLHRAPGIGLNAGMTNSGGTYFTYREETQAFEDIGIWARWRVSVTGLAEPEQVDAVAVTDGIFPLLRVQPSLGRGFTVEDDSPSAPGTVILGHGYWQRRFGGDPGVIGRTLRIDGREREIIGVTPQDFRFLQYDSSVYLPLRLDRSRVIMGGGFGYAGIARLRPGVTLEAANQDVARMIPIAVKRFGGITLAQIDEMGFGPDVRLLKEDMVGDVGTVLWTLLGTVGLVLLLACANVTNLFLARVEGRQREVAVRTALGAPRGRIAQRFLAESITMALLGGMAGLGFASVGICLLLRLAPANLPRLDEITIDPTVLFFTLGVSALTGLVFGLFPMLHYGRPNLNLVAALKEGGRGLSHGRARHRLRNLLAISEVALVLVLLIGSGLMIRSFQALRAVHPGFERPEEVLTVRLTVPSAEIPNEEEVGRLHEQILERLAAIPGVTSVAASSSIAMDGRDNYSALHIEDFPTPENQVPPVRPFKWIAGDYFTTMEIPLLGGRLLAWEDIRSRAPVAVVTDSFARAYWGEPSKALGKRIGVRREGPWREIVGVVGNVYSAGVDHDPPKLVYWPFIMEEFWGNPIYVSRTMAYAIRTARPDPLSLLPEVREAVWSVNPNLPLAGVQTLDQILAQSMARTSFTLVMLGLAAAVAVLLGTVGIYGVIAYIFAQRTHEIGVRMALGATRQDVSRLVLRQAGLVATAGVVIGLAAAVGLTQLMVALLFGVSPVDPVTYAAASVAVAIVSVLASYIPARRATKVNPIVALRYE